MTMSIVSIGGRQREAQRLAAALGHAEATLDALELDKGRHPHEGFFTRTKTRKMSEPSTEFASIISVASALLDALIKFDPTHPPLDLAAKR